MKTSYLLSRHVLPSRYLWRQLTPTQQEQMLAWRQQNKRPWHSPPHRPNFGHLNFHITGACYEHQPHIGLSPDRMETFTADLLEILSSHSTKTVAWCVLPNHYHVLVETPNVLRLLKEMGKFHGRTSHAWNGEENTRGRKVFHRSVERFMRSENHFWATINYIHHNPVRHGYVKEWTQWPWSSADDYLAEIGRETAKQIWHKYPILDYGKDWDDPNL